MWIAETWSHPTVLEPSRAIRCGALVNRLAGRGFVVFACGATLLRLLAAN
jgi:hypothetical protein